MYRRLYKKQGDVTTEGFNFDSVYAADQAIEQSVNTNDTANSILELEGLKPMDFKPSTPASRESMSIFGKAMSEDKGFLSSTLLRPSLDSSTVRPSITTSTTVKSSYAKPSSKSSFHRDEYQINLNNDIHVKPSSLSDSSAQLKSLESGPVQSNVTSNTLATKSFSTFTPSEVSAWLNSINMGKYASMFAENDMTGSVLSEIESVSDLLECGVIMPPPVARVFLKELSAVKGKGMMLS